MEVSTAMRWKMRQLKKNSKTTMPRRGNGATLGSEAVLIQSRKPPPIPLDSDVPLVGDSAAELAQKMPLMLPWMGQQRKSASVERRPGRSFARSDEHQPWAQR